MLEFTYLGASCPCISHTLAWAFHIKFLGFSDKDAPEQADEIDQLTQRNLWISDCPFNLVM